MRARTIALFPITLGALFSCDQVNMIAAGSFAYAETYELDYPETEVIEAITQFKRQYPEKIVPILPDGSVLKDQRRNESDHWFHVYFYDATKNQILNTWTRPAGRRKTTFALISVNKGLEIGNWKILNSDFNSEENRRLKNDFERQILKPIQGILAKKNK
ncbi:hypothetical protein JAO76_14240 [Pontibacter sp. BT310]|uniref:DUF4136 domain-containing protein n=1 Tax=Pontibacter populi TaxID=890055 RepID=A0ABS6XF07_9BACT|nr:MULTISPECIES: hypothetical protein [Pontibacter]MBJ6119365.1 hypothetical protein [Pontibacter sp. BT310]MBR0571793.1 hypothetical protein [Microvirga sp. STS03]MBW3366219.1 hypothetical protein [Pontibacter populi]